MEDFRTVEDDSPERCQAIGKHGQCNNAKVQGGNFCLMHGGNKVQEAQAREGLRNYRLTKFQARLQQLGDSPDIKSLRDEVAILRLLLEERLNQCKEAMDLIYQSGPISDLVIKIDKVVTSCHKLESACGSLLDRSAITQFGSELISLLSDELPQDKLNNISSKILELIGRSYAQNDA